MALIRLQGEPEKRRGIYYQVDSSAEPIGIGGMGKVYKGVCIDERNGSTRPVAIKFMYDDLPPHAYERARREAAIQLRNDNLVEMLGFIEMEEKLPNGEVSRHYHVVSELLTGVSLSDVMEGKTKDRDGNDVPFAMKMLQSYQNDSEHFARTVVISVLSGLMALHDAGYIHRDIDPSNIMLTADGHIKLIDFGIAKQMRQLTTGDKALTVAGKFMGKPEYAAPELVLGDIRHQDQTTDIYSVGILLFQCIVGHTPFEGARHEVLEKQLRSKMPLKTVRNKYLRRIIATACEKKQEERYQTSAQMRVALESIGENRPRRQPVKVYAIAATIAFIAVVAITTALFIKNRNDRLRREADERAVIALAAQQKRAEANDSIATILHEAGEMLRIGLGKEDEDSYELSLMKACISLAEAESLATRNESDYNPDDIAAQKSEAVAALDSAQSELLSQARMLEDMGETELADLYHGRIDSITTFKNNYIR